jgi:hypothetical protein
LKTCKPEISKMMKGISRYSESWTNIKQAPGKIVIRKSWFICLLFPSIKLQWTQVIETSEMSYTKVLNNGS